ncbi:DUF6197 family protein [Streptomyces scabiei]|uniref:DUF6197 family protein n=1 Tax=Streptomyces scabiei TaxID=1930 RepID=UPI0029900332|nr:DUF6197 family protein [Streptomyces scabiei]MDW8804341.1 DUF6197 family protein [Streptomyces scabiei]
MTGIRYSPDSVLVPTTPGALLEWAAAHIAHVGIYQSRYALFSGPGRLAHRRCAVGGALDVAAGRDRMAPDRTYDLEAIGAVLDEAYRILAQHLEDGPAHPPPGRDPATHHKVVVHQWTLAPGRTAHEAAAALHAAAEVAHTADRLF